MSRTDLTGQVEQVRAASDIVAVIQEYLPLKRKGRGYWGLCPFHEDKRPSFHVNPEKQIYKCFACGEGGDVFSFIMKREGVGFREALQMLAQRGGVTLSRDFQPAQEEQEKSPLFEVNAWAVETYHSWLKTAELGRPAREYFQRRHIPEETIDRLHLGYAPEGWDNLLRAARRAGWSDALLIEAGLTVPNDRGGCYDRFRDRVLFPILDPQGRAVAFGGRTLGDDDPKYLNTGETRLFQKGRTLYLAERAKLAMHKVRKAIVVEGYMDAIAAHEAGLQNTVAVLGTALTTDHVRFLKRYVDSAVLVFDGDAAGVRAANRSLEAFAQEELDARVAVLPDGLDPCDCLQQRGREAFEAELDRAVDPIAFRVRSVTEAEDGTGTGLTQAARVDEAIELIAQTPNPVARSFALSRVAQELNVPEPALRSRLDRAMRRGRAPAAENEEGVRPRRRDPETELVQVMLNRPETIPWVQRELDLDLIQGEAARLAAETIFRLHERNGRVTPRDVLAELHDAEPRDLVGRAIGEPTPEGVAADWARQLVETLRKRCIKEEKQEMRTERGEGQKRPRSSERLLREYIERKRQVHGPDRAPGPPSEPVVAETEEPYVAPGGHESPEETEY